MKRSLTKFAGVATIAAVFAFYSCEKAPPTPASNDITVSPTELQAFPAGGGAVSLAVTTETTWITILTGVPQKDDTSWLTATNGGTGNGIIELTLLPNELFTERKAILLVADVSGSNSVAINITQQAAVFTPSLEVDPTGLTFRGENPLSQRVTVTSNVTWEATTTNDWIYIDKNENGTSFDVSVSALATGERTGTISVASETLTRSITVNQNNNLQFVAGEGIYGVQGGLSHFIVSLTTYELNGRGQRMGAGNNLFVDLITNQPSPDNKIYLDIPAGTYTFDDDGEIGSIYPDGTIYGYFDANGKGTQLPNVTGGSVTVGGDHLEYNISIALTLQDGSNLKADFTGPILIHNPKVLSSLTGDIELGTVTAIGVQENHGSRMGMGLYNWYVTIYGDTSTLSIDDNFFYRGTGHVVNLEFITTGNSDRIAAGTYPINARLYDGNIVYQGTLNLDTRQGSWYYRYNDNGIPEMASLYGGNVTVAYEGDVCVITLDGYDMFYNNIAGTFRGTFEYKRI